VKWTWANVTSTKRTRSLSSNKTKRWRLATMTSKTRKTTIRLLMIPRMTKKCRSLKRMAKKGRTKKKSMATMFHSTETPTLWRMLKRKERVSLIKKMRI